MLSLADFMMYHWFPVSFFVLISSHTCACNMCFVSSFVINWQFRRIDRNGTQKPVSFLSPSSCTYNSHIKKKRKFSCELYTHSQLLCSLQILNCQLWESPSQPHTFRSTAVRRDIRAALYFCSCELRWRSTECVLLPCFNALPDIFAVMNCSCLRRPLIIYVHYSETLYPTTRKESACRLICTGPRENGGVAGAFPLCPFKRGAMGQRFFFITVSQVISWFIKIDLYSLQLFWHPENSEWFFIISVTIFKVNIVDEQKKT